MPRSTHPASSHSAAAERLEDRIAPAVLVNAQTLTFVDTDGDHVTVTISKGTLTTEEFGFDSAFDTAGPQQLQLVDFAGAHDKAGADLSITVTSARQGIAEGAAVGNGAVNVGYIDALGIDLGKVTIGGDLGRIDAGDANLTTPAVKQIMIASLGVEGLATQAAGGTLTSNITGPLSAFTTTGDLASAKLLVSGKIGSIEIGGNVIGGADAQSGSIRAIGAIGTVHVVGDVQGGSGEESGEILSLHGIGTVAIDGSIIGSSEAGSGMENGRVSAGGLINSATIGKNIVGGVGDNSGQLVSGAGMGTVQINGSVIGGAGFESGAVGSAGTIQSITIAQDLDGYDGGVDGAGASSGALVSSATIAKVTIGGDINGGTGMQSGIVATDHGLGSVVVMGSVFGSDGQESGAIGSKGPVGSVKVFGDLDGGEGNQSGHIVSTKTIGQVTVEGSVFGSGGQESGAIGAIGAVNSVNVGGDLLGGDGNRSGWISSQQHLGSVNITGSLGSSAGEEDFGVVANGRIVTGLSGSGLISGPIIDTINLGAIGSSEGEFEPGTIEGGHIGKINVADSIYNAFFSTVFIDAVSIGKIAVAHDVNGYSQSDPADISVRNSLGSLTIGGNATYLSVVAGGASPINDGPQLSKIFTNSSVANGVRTNLTDPSLNPDAQVGTVKVSGDWTASVVVVGAEPGQDGIFGTLDDQIVNGGSPSVVSTIARIQIDGQVFDGNSDTDAFGFIAQHVGAIIYQGHAQSLKAGPGNDARFLELNESNIFVRENNTDFDT